MALSLIGYRGVGKSTVGPELARRLGWACVDSDAEIERQAGCSIAEIFARQGEPAFRALEADVLQALLARDNLVIAAGGGAVLNPETRRRMQDSGLVVWLSAPVAVIAARLEADSLTSQRRPSLTGLPVRDEIARLLAIRDPIYAETAQLKVETAGRSVDEIVAEILDRRGRALEAGDSR